MEPPLIFGRTLQELIAPKSVEFYDSTWTSMGTRAQLVSHLSTITKIPMTVLENRDRLEQTSIAQRMSWAAKRSTSRIEDQAYSLLGLFSINMPLLYGEGSKAFMRLQEKLISTSPREDHSLLVWSSNQGRLLASSPSAFFSGDQIVNSAHYLDEAFELSKKGLRVTLLAKADRYKGQHVNGQDPGARSVETERYAETMLVALNCRYDDRSQDQRIALRLQRRPRVHTLGFEQQEYDVLGEVVYDRLAETTTVTSEELRHFTAMTLTIARKPYTWPTIPRRISISDHSTFACASQYLPEGMPPDFLEGVGGFFGLNILNASFAFSRLAIGSTQGSWPGVILAVGMVYNESPPKLLVHAFGSGQHDDLERLDVIKLCRMIREGEERSFEVAEQQALRVTARYVLIGGELMWNLEIGRPKVSLGTDPARMPIEIRRALDYPEVDVEPTVSRHTTAECQSDGGVQQTVGYPRVPTQRAMPFELPLLNTNLPPHLNNTDFGMVSAVPATSIDVTQYYQQQQFLAELYLAHMQKLERTPRPDFDQHGRPLRSTLRPQPGIRQTRLVRFMYDRLHRFFRGHTAISTHQELPTNRPAAEELASSHISNVSELGGVQTIPELSASDRCHELPNNAPGAELPAIPAIHILDSDEIYELDSTPVQTLSRPDASPAALLRPRLDDSGARDATNSTGRRFSWQLPIEQPPHLPCELSAQGRWAKLAIDTAFQGDHRPGSLSATTGAESQNGLPLSDMMLADQYVLSRFLEPRVTQVSRPMSAT